MKPSTLAFALLLAGSDAAYPFRRADEAVIDATGETERRLATCGDCCAAIAEANALIKSAQDACGSAAAGYQTGEHTPNPTCLLLLCSAYTTAHKVLEDAGCDHTEPYPDADLYCNLTPGLIPPYDPEIYDVDINYDFAIFPNERCVDFIHPANFTYGQRLVISGVTQPDSGVCRIDGDRVCYKPTLPFDEPDVCEVTACYDKRNLGPNREALKQCDNAFLTVNSMNEPTAAPSLSPTKEPCLVDLGLQALTVPDPVTTDMGEKGKPSKMKFRYIGEPCADPLANTQEGKATCEDFYALPTGSVKVISNSPYFGQNVVPGDIFEVTGSFGSNTEFTISTHDLKKKFQMVNIHTSASKPLQIGDVFGALQVWGFTVDGVEYTPLAEAVVKVTVSNVGTQNVTTTAGTLDPGTFPSGLINKFIQTGKSPSANTHVNVDTTGSTTITGTVTAAGETNGEVCSDDAELTISV